MYCPIDELFRFIGDLFYIKIISCVLNRRGQEDNFDYVVELFILKIHNKHYDILI